MSDMKTARLVLDSRCGTAESPVWDSEASLLYFADIPRGQLHRFDPATSAHQVWTFPDSLGSLGLCRSGRILICQKQALAIFDLGRETLTPLAAISEPTGNRLNDGKVDRWWDYSDFGVLMNAAPAWFTRNSTLLPFCAKASVTVPAHSASISFMSFIASMMQSVWPGRTTEPTSTNGGASGVGEQ